MSYNIDIYLFRDQFIFTGALDMYFEKYKGEGPGVYSHPIAVLSKESPVADIQQTLLQCECVLNDNKEMILKENVANDYMHMEKMLFQNFKDIGVKVSKSEIIKESILIKLRKSNNSFICRCTPKGRYMVVQMEIPLAADASLAEITEHIVRMAATD